MDPELSSLPHRPRLPGTYAAHYERDPSWTVGRALLLVVIALDLLGSMHTTLNLLLAGSFEGLLVLFTRVVLFALAYFTFWLGRGWARWPLVVVHGFAGIWLILWTLHLGGKTTLATGALYLAGALHLGTTAFLAFSADLHAFIRHQREHLRAGALAPAAIVLTFYLAALPATWAAFNVWQARLRHRAADFARASVQAIGTDWNPAELRRRASTELSKAMPANRLQWECANVASHLGALEAIDDPPLTQMVTLRNENGRGTFTRGFYRYRIRGNRQGGTFSLELCGDLAGSQWQIDGYSVRWDLP